MKSSRIVFAITFLSFYLTSCQDRINEGRNSEQEENVAPPTEYRKTEQPLPKLDRQKPVERPIDKEVKQKELKLIDTLKPVVAIP